MLGDCEIERHEFIGDVFLSADREDALCAGAKGGAVDFDDHFVGLDLEVEAGLVLCGDSALKG